MCPRREQRQGCLDQNSIWDGVSPRQQQRRQNKQQERRAKEKKNEQKAHFLPRTLTGKKIVCTARTCPGCRAGLQAMGPCQALRAGHARLRPHGRCRPQSHPAGICVCVCVCVCLCLPNTTNHALTHAFSLSLSLCETRKRKRHTSLPDSKDRSILTNRGGSTPCWQRATSIRLCMVFGFQAARHGFGVSL